MISHTSWCTPAADATHPWYVLARRRSLISTSEDLQIQTSRTDTSDQPQGRRHNFTLVFVGSLPLAVALWLFLPFVPAKPRHARTVEHPASMIAFLRPEAPGRSTDATLVLALGPQNAMINPMLICSAVPSMAKAHLRCLPSRQG